MLDQSVNNRPIHSFTSYHIFGQESKLQLFGWCVATHDIVVRVDGLTSNNIYIKPTPTFMDENASHQII